MRMPLTGAIVAATDLTEGSDDVLRAAAALARRTGAPLHVVHALEFPPAPYVGAPGELAGFAGRIEGAEAALDAQAARAVPADVPVAARRVEIYAAHRAISEYAEAVGAGLVVLGPHARRPVELGFLGTTADRVIRTASAPVLVVRGPLRLPLRRVVAPVDLSEPARGALDTAIAWTRGFGASDAETGMPGAELDILHVIPRAYDLPELPFSHATVLPGVNREVEAALARAGGAGSVDVAEEVRWGETPHDEIVRYAQARGADLVILATHGHGPLKRALIGATASVVVRHAPCPVLLVPPRIWHRAADAEPAASLEEPAFA